MSLDSPQQTYAVSTDSSPKHTSEPSRQVRIHVLPAVLLCWHVTPSIYSHFDLFALCLQVDRLAHMLEPVAQSAQTWASQRLIKALTVHCHDFLYFSMSGRSAVKAASSAPRDTEAKKWTLHLFLWFTQC